MTNCTCNHRPWSYTDPEPMPDQDCPAHGDPAILRTQDEDIVAYRSQIGGMLRCLAHAPKDYWPEFVEPVTAEDLPDGGICTHRDCGADVLIPSGNRRPAVAREFCR